MIRIITAAAALLCAFAFPAEARKLHASGLDPMCNVTMPCIPPTASTPAQVRETRGKYISREMGFGAPATPRRKRHGVQAYGAPSPSIGYSVGMPVRYIAGRLICAVNVGSALAERGIKGTGSALALSYLHWGHSAGGPVPGAVIVSGRRGGGHVAIVSRVENGVVYAWNATGGQHGWREIPYRHSVIDYRVPG